MKITTLLSLLFVYGFGGLHVKAEIIKDIEVVVATAAMNGRIAAGPGVPTIAYLRTSGGWNICVTEDLGATEEILPGNWPGMSLNMATAPSGEIFIVLDKEILDQGTDKGFRACILYHRNADGGWNPPEQVNDSRAAMPAGQVDSPQVAVVDDKVIVAWYHPWAVGFFSRECDLATGAWEEVISRKMPHGKALAGLFLLKPADKHLHLFSAGIRDGYGPQMFEKNGDWMEAVLVAGPGDENNIQGPTDFSVALAGSRVDVATLTPEGQVQLYQDALNGLSKMVLLTHTKNARCVALAGDEKGNDYVVYDDLGNVCLSVIDGDGKIEKPVILASLGEGKGALEIRSLMIKDELHILITKPDKQLLYQRYLIK